MRQHGVIAVSGASAGVGRAIAREFAGRAEAVALLARGEGGLAAAAREVEEAGARALAVSVDVADAEAVDQAIGRIENELGPVDVWVNAAFASILGPFMEKSLRTSLEMSGGDFGIFLTRPISITLLVLAALIVAVSTLRLAALRTIRSAETRS